MKKLVVAIFIIIILLLSNISVYSSIQGNDYYSINIPNTYMPTENGLFKKSDGTNIGINIVNIGNAPYDFEYNNKYLNYLYDESSSSIETGIKNAMIQNYSSSLTSSQLQVLLDSFELNCINKEITTIGVNNYYQCFHYCFEYEILNQLIYQDSYIILSGSDAYSIIITAQDSTYINSYEVTEMLSSFYIKDFQSVAKSNNHSTFGMSEALEKAFTVGLATFGLFRKNVNKESTKFNNEKK